tara:strand:- start:148 stop:612 length:465 start_codon:yes stop_codon:yes gene_type:complete
VTLGEHHKIDDDMDLKNILVTIRKAYHDYGSILLQIFDGRQRSGLQNALQHAMYREIGKQLYGGDFDHAKSECKLTLGVPLLREESEEFKRVYDRSLKGIPYGEKLQLIGLIDVSSLLSMADAHKYIDEIYDTYAFKGVNWTDFINRSRDALKA